MQKLIILAAGSMMLLGGCATEIMSKKECAAGDWYGAGLEDGAAGLLENAFDDRANACFAHETGADPAAYFDGRSAALLRLCNEAGGYEFGRSRSIYRGVCDKSPEPGFLGGYLTGVRISDAEYIRDAAQNELEEADKALSRQREQVRIAEDRLADPALPAEDLEDAREDLGYARDRLRQFRQRREDGVYELGRADENLDQTLRNIEDWRGGDEFHERAAMLSEAFEFARAHPDVSHCVYGPGVYEPGRFLPVCYMAPGAALRETGSEAICADGPAELRLARVRVAGPSHPVEVGSVHEYDIHPIDERGRASRDAKAVAEVIFENAQDTSLHSVRCVAAIPR